MKSPVKLRRASAGICLLALASTVSASFAVACSGAPTPSIDDVDPAGEGNATTQTTTTTATTTTPSPSSTSSASSAPAGTTTGAEGSDAGTGAGGNSGDASIGNGGGADASVDASTGGGSKDAGKEAGPEASTPPPPTPPSNGHHPPSTPPTQSCSYSPDSNGFFTMTESQGTYVVRLPAGYDKTKPYPVIIGTHGCGDTAYNYCSWAPAAWNQAALGGDGEEENDVLGYIAISVEDVSDECWQIADSGKVLAALDDAISCFYVDQGHVTMAGYSSGAAVAYEVGLANALRFSGILIEDGALYDNGANEAPLLANAAWKINIAHIAHISDPDYPLASVQADWQVIDNAGFSVKEYVVAGDHSGTSIDWYGTLDPEITGWSAP